jgi:hypothetical protein
VVRRQVEHRSERVHRMPKTRSFWGAVSRIDVKAERSIWKYLVALYALGMCRKMRQ